MGILEVIALSFAYDVPLLIQHIHSTSLHRTKEALALVDAAQKRGLNVLAEAYPYDFGSSVIGADYLGEGFQETMLMDYSDILYIKTGERMTKELLAKYRKEDPGGFMMMHHMRMEDGDAAMKQMGRLKPGAGADITIFNPDTVTDNAVAETGKFALPSTGIPYVIVNGTIVVKDSEVLKVYPGRAIKGNG